MVKTDSRNQIQGLIWPIFIELLLVTLMGATDTFMLSQYNDDAVAAVGVANQVISLAFLIFQIINNGTSVLCSQFLGAGRRDKMHQVTAMALLLNLVSGIIISLLLSLGAPWLLKWMGLSEELMVYGKPYMQLIGAFAFFQALHLTISASLRADHKAIYPMLVIILVNIVNIVANYGLIFGHFGLPALGVRGAAIATDIARCTAMVSLFIILFTRHIRWGAFCEACRAPYEELKQIMGDLLRIGLPSAGENMSYQAQQLVLTFFMTQLGTVALTTRVYVFNATMFVYIFCICMAQAAAIVIGHQVGEKHYDASYSIGWWGLKVALVITLLLSLGLACIGTPVMQMLSDNPEVIALGASILIIDIAVEGGKVSNIYYTNVLRAVGDVNFPFYVGIIAQWLLGVGFGWFLGIHLGWGLKGMWCAFILDESVRGLIFVWRWYSRRWQNRSFVR